MDRARRLANRAILKRLITESRRHHPPSFPPPRYISSLSPSVFPTRHQHKNAGPPTPPSFPPARSISVESLKPSDTFPRRHNSASLEDQAKMFDSCGYPSLDSLIDATVPKSIRLPAMKFSKFDAGSEEDNCLRWVFSDVFSRFLVIRPLRDLGGGLLWIWTSTAHLRRSCQKLLPFLLEQPLSNRNYTNK